MSWHFWLLSEGLRPLILLAFLLPVAIYLLVLGGIHRRAYPLVVSGTWDSIGLLLASSGLLLVGGPAILSSLNERWRMFWLLGRTGSSQTTGEGLWQFWIFLSALYFLVVIFGAAYMLWSSRSVTSIYNLDPRTLEQLLEKVFDQLGISPTRSGRYYLFGVSLDPLAGKVASSSLLHASETQAISASPASSPESAEKYPAWDSLASQGAVLEVDSFAAMHHVTLRWSEARSPLRDSVEGELEQLLARTPASPSEVGAWLTMSGLATMLLFLMGAIALVLARLLF